MNFEDVKVGDVFGNLSDGTKLCVTYHGLVYFDTFTDRGEAQTFDKYDFDDFIELHELISRNKTVTVSVGD